MNFTDSGHNNSDWDERSPYLPKEDSYMYAEDGEFEDEINYFSLFDETMSTFALTTL